MNLPALTGVVSSFARVARKRRRLISPGLQPEYYARKIKPSAFSQYLVGFENHSGNTFIVNSDKNTSEVARSDSSEVDGKTIPLGKVIVGFGNNGVDKTEGAIYKNCLGTYLHGPVLPKNPHLADWLLKTALKRKYQKPVELKPLDDTLEIKTHQSAEKRTRQTKRSWFW